MSGIAEYDPKDFENVNAAAGVYAKFYTRPIPNDAKTLEEGRPIFDEVVFVEIIAAGNGTNIIRRPARDTDKQRFRQAYSQFLEGAEQVSGTPLTEVAWITASQREELTYIKVRTLEQLAELNDQACTRIPGLYELKRKASAWMAQAKEAAPFEALHAENAELKERLAALEKSMSESKGGSKPPKAEKQVPDPA